MAVYRLEVGGKPTGELIKAKSQAQAIGQVVTAKALNPDEVADAIANGATVKTVSEPPKAD